MNTRGKVITFGCRLNACESEIIQEFVDELGLDDFTLINTCAVTAEAERQLRQAIRKLYKEDNNVKIILTGCASEADPDLYMKMDGVVGIVSNNLKLSRKEYEKYAGNSHKNRDQNRAKLTTERSHLKRVRAFLQIQNGCDQKCTYCIVRMTRGPNVSFDKDEIVAQAKKLLAKGYKEIVLTGVNISAYGRDMNPSSNLAEIVRYILKNVPELRRLRLSSIDPADIDDNLTKLIANEERIMPHIHESIQSGDNLTLKRMTRRHFREQIIEANEKLLSLRPDIIFGADIIAGFPTETDEMFANTCRLIEEAHISLLHVFPFSSRPGTPAALMPKVPRPIVLKRAKDLRIIAKNILHKKLETCVGRDVRILAETTEIAKTDSFLIAKSLERLIPGNEYRFHVTSCNEKQLIGAPVRGD